MSQNAKLISGYKDYDAWVVHGKTCSFPIMKNWMV